MNGNINEFKVHTGLRQGCVLPITLSLIINSAVKELKEETCCVECGDEIVSGLLFADDTCLVVASDVTVQLHNLKKRLHKTQMHYPQPLSGGYIVHSTERLFILYVYIYIIYSIQFNSIQ